MTTPMNGQPPMGGFGAPSAPPPATLATGPNSGTDDKDLAAGYQQRLEQAQIEMERKQAAREMALNDVRFRIDRLQEILQNPNVAGAIPDFGNGQTVPQHYAAGGTVPHMAGGGVPVQVRGQHYYYWNGSQYVLLGAVADIGDQAAAEALAAQTAASSTNPPPINVNLPPAVPAAPAPTQVPVAPPAAPAAPAGPRSQTSSARQVGTGGSLINGVFRPNASQPPTAASGGPPQPQGGTVDPNIIPPGMTGVRRLPDGRIVGIVPEGDALAGEYEWNEATRSWGPSNQQRHVSPSGAQAFTPTQVPVAPGGGAEPSAAPTAAPAPPPQASPAGPSLEMQEAWAARERERKAREEEDKRAGAFGDARASGFGQAPAPTWHLAMGGRVGRYEDGGEVDAFGPQPVNPDDMEWRLVQTFPDGTEMYETVEGGLSRLVPPGGTNRPRRIVVAGGFGSAVAQAATSVAPPSGLGAAAGTAARAARRAKGGPVDPLTAMKPEMTSVPMAPGGPEPNLPMGDMADMGPETDGPINAVIGEGEDNAGPGFKPELVIDPKAWEMGLVKVATRPTGAAVKGNSFVVPLPPSLQDEAIALGKPLEGTPVEKQGETFRTPDGQALAKGGKVAPTPPAKTRVPVAPKAKGKDKGRRY